MNLRRYTAVLLPLAFTACLKGTDYSTNAYPNIPIEQTTFASVLNVDLANSTKSQTGLYYRDLTVGNGATATSTSTVSVYYALYFPNGYLLQSVSSPSDTFGPIQLGTNSIIKGWEEGLVGMKVGGTRQLIVPPELAYGSTGTNLIPPNAILVFTIQLMTVQ